MGLEGITDAIGGIADETQKSIGTFGEPNINLMGLNIPGVPLISTTDYFLVQMESWFTAIPRNTHWVVIIDRIPPALTSGLIKKLENVNSTDNSWDTTAAVKAITSFPFMKVNGCLFAQNCSLPGESYTIEAIGTGNMGGFIQGTINSQRKTFADAPLTIGFRETNTSFIDMVIRPWVVLGSHFGRIARPDDKSAIPGKSFLGMFTFGGSKEQFAMENMKTNITIIQYSTSYQKISQIPRKVWTFYNCMPYQIREQELKYDKEDLVTNETAWSYDYYEVRDNMYLPLPDLINKMKRGLKMPKISPFQK